MKETLEAIRAEIDAIDDRILDLLNQRMRLALDTRAHKSQARDPEREQVILERIAASDTPYLSVSLKRDLYKLILAHSRKLQKADER